MILKTYITRGAATTLKPAITKNIDPELQSSFISSITGRRSGHKRLPSRAATDSEDTTTENRAPAVRHLLSVTSQQS